MFTTRIFSADMANVIVETDMTLDVDDVGALAVIHALADRNEAQLLGVSFNEKHPDGVKGIAAINAWYDRVETPIAQFSGTLESPDESRYLSYLAKMLDESVNVRVLDAMDFYQEILSSQQDQSVTIISLGFLNNLAELLKTHPTLIKQKVLRLVAMGGRVNDNFNFVRHELVGESQFVIEHWPTQLVVTDFGGNLHSGVSLSSTSSKNPVREAYFRWFNRSFKGRSSWDQVAVLVGVRGEAGGFEFVGDLAGRLQNGFTWQFDGQHRAYARPTKSPNFYLAEIEALMSVKPRAH
ncbi:MAG: nucleoside hydrolase [Gammaproteobacteria bacterium]|nr:nucleoside hydrolase [Gammaproteobacteria bacterium]